MKKICPRCGEVWEGYHDESNSNHFCKTGCLSYSEANTPVTPEYYQGQICDGCGNEFFVKALTKINERIFCEECLYVYKNSFNKEYHKRPLRRDRVLREKWEVDMKRKKRKMRVIWEA